MSSGISVIRLSVIRFGVISLSWVLLVAGGLITSVAAESYARPVAALDALVDLPRAAQSQLSPDQRWLLLATPVARPTIAALKAETAATRGLAGIAIDVERRLLNSEPRYASFSLQMAENMAVVHQIIAPEHGFLLAAKFSPNSRYLSFILADDKQLRLQLLDLQTGHRLPDGMASAGFSAPSLPINAVTGVWYQWASDSQSLLAPVAESLPAALLQHTIQPTVQQSDGQRQPQRILQLLLKTAQQQQLFAALLTATVQQFDLTLHPTKLTRPEPLQHFSLSPDRQHLLLETLPMPYSYHSRVDRFAIKRQVIELTTGKHTEIASQPLDEGRKTRQGPRAVQWHTDAPSTLLWREIPGKKQQADTLWSWQPAQRTPRLLAKLPWRLEQVYSGQAQQLLLLEEQAGVVRASWLDLNSGKLTLWYQQQKNRKDYHGTPLTTAGNDTALQHWRQQKLLFKRESSQRQQQLFAYEWNKPLASQSGELVWQSQLHYREQVKAVFSDQSLLLERQSPVMPPALWRWSPTQLQQLSKSAAMPASWANVEQQQVSFQRADGTQLSGTLYLPKGFTRSKGPLPTLIWAYPREYESQQDLQAAIPHPLNYPMLSANNAAVLAAAGFAVFDKVTMPILANDKKLANDHYLPQLIANAEAAVAVLERLGVAKRGEIAIGGHSYGAFMVANLLAHTDLFAAGIARSGAYNRTLTPFGFQSEQRNLWQQQPLYLTMSPYLVADKINAPLLLIHGEADSNSGTRPQQSELMFAALRGLGIPGRLVILPYEGHHYRARESVQHVLAEQYQWLQQHLLTAKRPAAVVVTH